MPTGFWEELANDPAVFPRALIIDGPSLLDIMTDRDTQFVLLKFSNLCKVKHSYGNSKMPFWLYRKIITHTLWLFMSL